MPTPITKIFRKILIALLSDARTYQLRQQHERFTKKFMRAKEDPYAHLRLKRKIKLIKQKPIKPVIKKITKEIMVERTIAAQKIDGIPLQTVTRTGVVLRSEILQKDEFDLE